MSYVLTQTNGELEEVVEEREEGEARDKECKEALPTTEQLEGDAMVENVHEVNVNANVSLLSLTFTAGLQSAA